MVNNENIYYVPKEYKKTEEIRYFEYQNNYRPNWFAKTFLSTAYCCKNTLCGCSCSSQECTCANSGKWDNDSSGYSASGRTWVSSSEVGAAGRVGAGLERDKNSSEEVRYGSVSAGGKVKASLEGVNLKGEVGVNLHEYKSDGIYARTGINVDTGVSLDSEGVELKAIGFGLSVGKKTGISTPFFEISKTSDDCVIQ